jgi:plastocyanin
LRYTPLRRVRFRTIALSVPLAAAALALLAPALASAAITPTGITDTISIQEVNGALKFVAPVSVTQGDELKIVNETNPKKVGPHTFSLVEKGALPKTGPARKNCFTPKHICLSIAKWHGLNQREEVTINPAKAGPEGWSTMGSLTKKGDSWFSGEKKGTSFTQQVSAEPGTLYFMCAIHPWMQGQVTVLPGK